VARTVERLMQRRRRVALGRAVGIDAEIQSRQTRRRLQIDDAPAGPQRT